MKTYKSLDFLNEDDILSPEEKQIQRNVRNFIDKLVIPKLQDAHRKEKFPQELIPEFGKLGLLGSHLKGHGLAGVSSASYGLIMQELERADSGIRSFCSVQGSLCMFPIWAYGSEEQKNKYLEKMGKGELIGAFGLTESDAGSNPAGMQTTAKTISSGYLLKGSKMWITNGAICDLAIIWARLDGGKIRGFILEKDTPGFTHKTIEGKFSLRISNTAELHFDNCKIPKENILPEIEGLKGPLSCLTEARYGIAWGVIGAANAVYDCALNYAKERDIFGKKQAELQLVQAKLVKMMQEITKAKLICLQLAKLKDQGKLRTEQVSLAKMNNCRMALNCARDARDILGANGIIDEYPIIRHLMNLETVNTYEGTEDIHRLILGQAITGYKAFI